MVDVDDILYGDAAFFKTQEKKFSQKIDQQKYLVLRFDGKGFSKLTRRFNKPFDEDFTAAMMYAATAVVASDCPALLVYVQSDEISVIIDQTDPAVQQWFNGKIEKTLTVVASLISVSFYQKMSELKGFNDFSPVFDGRVCGLFSADEVALYLQWRRSDASRNSINMLAHYHFGHKKILGMKKHELLELLKVFGKDWQQECPIIVRGGVFAYTTPVLREVSFVSKKTGEKNTTTVYRNSVCLQPAESFDMKNWRDLK